MLGAGELQVRLVEGRRYMITHGPLLLHWIAAHQSSYFAWPDYPAAAMPVSPL